MTSERAGLYCSGRWLGTQAAKAAQKATKVIPIVATASNPLGNGLVISLAHPGGNLTGLSFQSPELSGKRLALLRQIAANPAVVAALYNPDDPPALSALKEILEAAEASVRIISVAARNPNEFGPAFDKTAESRPGALVIMTSPLMFTQARLIAKFALRMKLPAIYADPRFAQVGGLMTYGPNFDAITKELAVYVDKIFKGTKPANCR